MRYSIRDIPIFDGKGDATHLIEFEDFLANTGSDIKGLPQHGEPHEVDGPHYEAVMKDVVNKFKTSLKGKPRLWYEMQYPTSDDEPAKCCLPDFLFCRVRSVRWFGGIVMRGCALRSLLGTYVHQKYFQ